MTVVSGADVGFSFEFVGDETEDGALEEGRKETKRKRTERQGETRKKEGKKKKEKKKKKEREEGEAVLLLPAVATRPHLFPMMHSGL